MKRDQGGSGHAGGRERGEAQAVSTVAVLIIGAGISGIGAGIRLLKEGVTDFVILEKADALGGTWRDNTYPGCACDVPSALYSYSFAQNARWSRVFAAQREILDYVDATAVRHRVTAKIRYSAAVEAATWDEAAGHWVVRSVQGCYHARTLICCAGYLHEPQIPAIPGLREFPGTLFHSSRWRHDHDLRGERVAIVGTGASAIQFVPEIQPQVAELRVYQRTPQWILPKPDRAVSRFVAGLFRLPFVLGAWRKTLYLAFETFGIGFRRPDLLTRAQKLARAQLRRQVKDPLLRKKLTPDYRIGCKRVLLSNNYYPALTQPNVEVLATGVREVRGRTLIGQDGSEREVDTIILGTGFHVTDQPIAAVIRGSEGRSLAEVWSGSPQAYRGTCVAGFPNFFLLLGPNLAIGHNSAFIIIEAQLDYTMSALRTMRRRQLARIEVKSDQQSVYNTMIQEALQTTVWNAGGCSSYYLDANGRNSTGFPWSTLKMRRLLGRFDVDNYRVERRGSA